MPSAGSKTVSVHGLFQRWPSATTTELNATIIQTVTWRSLNLFVRMVTCLPRQVVLLIMHTMRYCAPGEVWGWIAARKLGPEYGRRGNDGASPYWPKILSGELCYLPEACWLLADPICGAERRGGCGTDLRGSAFPH